MLSGISTISDRFVASSPSQETVPSGSFRIDCWMVRMISEANIQPARTVNAPTSTVHDSVTWFRSSR